MCGILYSLVRKSSAIGGERPFIDGGCTDTDDGCTDVGGGGTFRRVPVRNGTFAL